MANSHKLHNIANDFFILLSLEWLHKCIWLIAVLETLHKENLNQRWAFVNDKLSHEIMKMLKTSKFVLLKNTVDFCNIFLMLFSNLRLSK